MPSKRQGKTRPAEHRDRRQKESTGDLAQHTGGFRHPLSPKKETETAIRDSPDGGRRQGHSPPPPLPPGQGHRATRPVSSPPGPGKRAQPGRTREAPEGLGGAGAPAAKGRPASRSRKTNHPAARQAGREQSTRHRPQSQAAGRGYPRKNPPAHEQHPHHTSVTDTKKNRCNADAGCIP